MDTYTHSPKARVTVREGGLKKPSEVKYAGSYKLRDLRECSTATPGLSWRPAVTVPEQTKKEILPRVFHETPSSNIAEY